MTQNKNQSKDNKESDLDPQASNKDINVDQKPEEVKPGPTGKFLLQRKIPITIIEPDHIGIEIISIGKKDLFSTASLLKDNGFDYLQCQGGYDEGAGQKLVCFYHLIAMKEFLNRDIANEKFKLREVRLKVFLERDGDLKVDSIYKLFRGADWQERETFDMFGINFDGHPHPKRLLMPEDWKGWPLRKDYVQPDFYEMQDAY